MCLNIHLNVFLLKKYLQSIRSKIRLFAKFIFCPIHWVTRVDMAETTYYEDKVYLPKGVREKLGLVDGDVLHLKL
jgi:hypothetical protein